MKRKDALAAIKVAGYHDDQRAAMRIYTEHRICMAAYQDAYATGRRLKAEGMRCACPSCNR